MELLIHLMLFKILFLLYFAIRFKTKFWARRWRTICVFSLRILFFKFYHLHVLLNLRFSPLKLALTFCLDLLIQPIYSYKKFSGTDIIKMLVFLIDSIFVMFGGCCLQQTVIIAMDLHLNDICYPPLANLVFLKNWMHSFEVSLGYECVDRTTFSTLSATVLHWKCTSVNAFIPQWNFKRMHSILIHQNLI